MILFQGILRNAKIICFLEEYNKNVSLRTTERYQAAKAALKA